VSTSSVIYLVRHAKAGERRTWEGDDMDRPLSKAGWKQANALGKRLARKGATTLHSSPYVRCTQTLEPLAERLGTTVTEDDRLLEGAPFEGALELLAELGDGAVLCSHGDLIPEVVEALVRRGMVVESPADWRKATVWVLSRNGDGIVEGTVWPPPS
jgi:8-oxo-dGTP diphosphatase